MKFSDLPVSQSFLEQYRLNARRHVRPHLVGGHITRRMGQSLEFQEYAQYTLGDDVRYIDWRASARTLGRGGANPWDGLLVRKFMAEEHLKLVISIDTRETMAWPQLPQNRSYRTPNICKLQVARWIAEALMFIALRTEDRVVLHPLFGTPIHLRAMSGTGGQTPIRQEIDRVAGKIASSEQFNAQGLDRHLPPASAWVIITDFYFDPEDQGETQHLLHRIKTAKNKMRWVILVDLDSLPYEQLMLDRGARMILGPGSDEKKLIVTDKMIASVGATISAHKQRFFNTADHTIWAWDTHKNLHEYFDKFFERQFKGDRLLQRLFKRDV